MNAVKIEFSKVLEITQVAEETRMKLLEVRYLTNHPDDHYLFVTLCENHKGEFVVHTYNSSFNSFQLGHYFTDRDEALTFYKNKK